MSRDPNALRITKRFDSEGNALTYPDVTGTATIGLPQGIWGCCDLGFVRRLNDLYVAHLEALFPNVIIRWSKDEDRDKISISRPTDPETDGPTTASEDWAAETEDFNLNAAAAEIGQDYTSLEDWAAMIERWNGGHRLTGGEHPEDIATEWQSAFWYGPWSLDDVEATLGLGVWNPEDAYKYLRRPGVYKVCDYCGRLYGHREKRCPLCGDGD